MAGPNDPKSGPDLDALMRQQRQAAAVKRQEKLGPGKAEPAVKPAAQRVGELLGKGTLDGQACWFLEGRAVGDGDVIEVFTNAANGWLRGRVTDVAAKGTPALSINLWDPNGAPDGDGTPPWVGEVIVPLPSGAVCKWPHRG